MAENSCFVRIDSEKISEFCQNYHPEEAKHYTEFSPIKIVHLSDEQKSLFFLFFNALNFCFWGEPKWNVEFQGKNYDGAVGLLVAILKAYEKNKFLLDPHFFGFRLSKSEFREILKGNGEIPLFDERYDSLRSTGKALVAKFGGSLKQMADAADWDASALAFLIARSFPSFNDVAQFQGKKIYFLKRAQLLVADLYRQTESFSKIGGIDNLTAFADYKIPQALRYLGILVYSDNLAKKIDGKSEIKQGSREEIEIRANMIWAIELIRKNLAKRFSINAVELDACLWRISQSIPKENNFYHRTRTIFY